MSDRKTYRGWSLVQTGQNYYHAAKGNIRVAIGAVRHGDYEEMKLRFKRKVDEMEGKK